MVSLLLVTLITLLPHSVFSQQVRNFPANSRLGDLTAVSFPLFIINGQQVQMGAGGQIRGTDNLIILPSVANYIGFVRYQLDVMGSLHRMWILTPEEADQAKQEELLKPQ
ncbi:MAG: hypothetical protein H0X02_04550 [Nitrosomonas sp.]|nr:hypothetical protein [Nitrosomonas sp.]